MQYRDFPGDIAMKTLLNNAGATGSISGQGIKIYLKYNTRNDYFPQQGTPYVW